MSEPLIGRCHVCGRLAAGSGRAAWRYGKAVSLFTCNSCQLPHQTPPLKVWIDPPIAGTAPAQPVRSAIDDLAPTLNPKKKEPDDMTSPAYRQKFTAFKQSVDRMAERLEVRPLREVARDAGLHSNWGHTNPEAKQYYQTAVTRIERLTQGDAIAPVPTPDPVEPPAAPVPPVTQTVALEEELHRLKQELEEKTRRLSELQWEVEQADLELEKATAYTRELEARSQPPEPTADPYPWILQQRDLWQQKAEELAADLAAAEKNYQAFRRLADLYETPIEEPNGARDQISSDDPDHRRTDSNQSQAAFAELPRSLSNGAAVAGSRPLG